MNCLSYAWCAVWVWLSNVLLCPRLFVCPSSDQHYNRRAAVAHFNLRLLTSARRMQVLGNGQAANLVHSTLRGCKASFTFYNMLFESCTLVVQPLIYCIALMIQTSTSTACGTHVSTQHKRTAQANYSTSNNRPK